MNDGELFIPGLFLGALLGLAIGIWITSSSWTTDIKRTKNEAVSRGYAEYFVDSKYERQWRWK